MTTTSPTTARSEAILLDANVLIAASVIDHEHHRRARDWLGAVRRFATCPVTQGSLARYLVRVADTEHAIEALKLIDVSSRHEFWPDDTPYDGGVLTGVVGHRQVTDAYLAASAARRGAQIATFDRKLALLRPASTLLVP